MSDEAATLILGLFVLGFYFGVPILSCILCRRSMKNAVKEMQKISREQDADIDLAWEGLESVHKDLCEITERAPKLFTYLMETVGKLQSEAALQAKISEKTERALEKAGLLTGE